MPDMQNPNTGYPTQQGYPSYNYAPQNTFFDPYGVFGNRYQNNYPQPQPPQATSTEPPKPTTHYRPVGGIEEVKALSIDWDGSIYILEDAAAGTLYIKQYIDGAVKTKAFQRIEIAEPAPVNYATAETVEELKKHIEALEKRLSVPQQNIKGDFDYE